MSINIASLYPLDIRWNPSYENQQMSPYIAKFPSEGCVWQICPQGRTTVLTSECMWWKGAVNSEVTEYYIEKFANMISDKNSILRKFIYTGNYLSTRTRFLKNHQYCLIRECQKLLWIRTKRWLLLAVLMLQVHPKPRGQWLGKKCRMSERCILPVCIF